MLLVPKSVQTGSPILGQVSEDAETGSFSCGSALGYAFGSRPWEDDDPQTYQNNRFTTVSAVCPGRLESNLWAGVLWTAIGVAILVIRQIVVRRNQRRTAARQPAQA